MHKKNELLTNIKRNKILYLMVIPGVVWFIMFRIIPDLGIIIAFMDYNIFKGLGVSKFVGFKHFTYLFQYDGFYTILRNTLLLSTLGIVFGFPVPIILALGLNEIRSTKLKRSIQSILYLPHFFSWVIIGGLFFQALSINGFVNNFMEMIGQDKIVFVQQDWFFRPMYIVSGWYRDAGYGTIVYLAAIATIPSELYESAMIDGAGKLQRILYITIPSLLPTIVVLLLLRIGNFMSLGFDQVYNLLTPLTWDVGDIFDTYVYRVGITEGQYSLTTAIGLFQSLIGFLLIYTFNKLTKRVSGGLW
jgi:putative aldouronate transport system permease protein